MNSNTQTNRIIAFDYLRTVAAFTVVVLHVAAPLFLQSFPTQEWSTANLYEAFVRWNVPVFIMISGALFLKKDKKLDLRKLYTKNILRIIVVLLFWSIVYAIPGILNGNNINYFIAAIIQGPVHFWFLKVLIGLYIAIPIYKLFATNQKTELYFLIIAFITGVLLPSCFSVIGMFNMQIKETLVNIYNGFDIKVASTYSFYFVIGHYLVTYPIIKYRKLLYLSGGISIVSFILLTYYCSYAVGKPIEIFMANSCLFTMLEAVAIYTFFTSCDFKVDKSNILVDKLSRNSFGIYIIHILVIHFLNKYFLELVFNYPMLFIPLFSLLVFVVSFFIIEILHKIPFINKWTF